MKHFTTNNSDFRRATGWPAHKIGLQLHSRRNLHRDQPLIGCELGKKEWQQVETTKRSFMGSNRKGPLMAMPARKLELDLKVSVFEEPEKVVPRHVDPWVAKAIQSARVQKGWTQAQLAKSINQKVCIVVEHEQGKALFNNNILSAMEKQLGVKLRGARSQVGKLLQHHETPTNNSSTKR